MTKIRINHAQVAITANRLTTRYMRKSVARIHAEAVINASTGPYTTGRMASSITSHVYTSGLKVHARVGSDLRYAAFSDTGTAPHVIRPRGPGYPLRFYWRKVGRVVRFRKVNHPGQRSKGWLTDPLVAEARRRGWKVVISD